MIKGALDLENTEIEIKCFGNSKKDWIQKNIKEVGEKESESLRYFKRLLKMVLKKILRERERERERERRKEKKR